MYAVIRTGGKQYRVAPGNILEVEKLDGNVGDTVVLDDVLMVVKDGEVTIGQPTVAGSTVTAKITGQHRGEKILVFRYRPKKRIRVRRGHRQYLTRLQIQAIDGETGHEASDAAATAEVDTETVVVQDVVAEDTVAEDTVAEDTVAEDIVAEDVIAEDVIAEDVVAEDIAEEPEVAAAPDDQGEGTTAEKSSAEEGEE